jgi:nitronate monooxygenase
VLVRELRRPIVLAPLAGGPSTPALAAAVSEAGGLGFLASGYLNAGRLQEELVALRALTTEPFGVNVFVPGNAEVDEHAVRAYVDRLRATEAILYDTAVGEPRFDDDDWDAKLRLLAAERVPVVSFTFGCPAPEVVAAVKEAGSEVWVTVTDGAEARLAEAAGADALVLQGIEAGGHRASFVDSDDAAGLGVLTLLRVVANESRLPLIATGGIGDGAGVAAVLAAGAAAAQLGTAFMRAPEAGTNPAHRAALAAETPTALTRAFTGRLARGLVNRFLLEHSSAAPLAYPHIHHVTAPLRAVARSRADADGFNLWAGQAHTLAKELPAAQIVGMIADEARLALERASGRFSG